MLYGKYSILGVSVLCQIQHSALPHAVLATQPHPPYCIFHVTRNGALTYMYADQEYITQVIGLYKFIIFHNLAI